MEDNGLKWLKMENTTNSVFRGAFQHKLDKQGRIALPARFRDVLKEMDAKRLIGFKQPNRIEVYPEAEWRLKEFQLQQLNWEQDEVSDYVHYVLSNIEEMKVDDQGRIVIPDRWRAQLELKNLAVLIGMIKMFEIWPESEYGKSYPNWAQQYPKNRAYVAGLKKEGKTDERI